MNDPSGIVGETGTWVVRQLGGRVRQGLWVVRQLGGWVRQGVWVVRLGGLVGETKGEWVVRQLKGRVREAGVWVVRGAEVWTSQDSAFVYRYYFCFYFHTQ